MEVRSLNGEERQQRESKFSFRGGGADFFHSLQKRVKEFCVVQVDGGVCAGIYDCVSAYI